MIIDFTTFGIDVHIELNHKVCVLFSDSGEGKTFLFSILKNISPTLNVNVTYVDYSFARSSSLTEMVSGDDELIILDDVDLYAEKCGKVLSKENVATKIVVAKRVTNLHISDDFAFYKLESSSDRICISEGRK